jgi:cell wall-associated NlpC family hydrolase
MFPGRITFTMCLTRRPDREEIVAAARSTLGVRWRHQGRDPELGLDCAGLIVWVGWETGHLPRDFDVSGYRRTPDGRTLQAALRANARQKSWPDWKPGDFVLLRELGGTWPCHLGFLVERAGSDEPNMIHSWARIHRCCVEVRFEKSWQRCLVGLYSFKGVD